MKNEKIWRFVLGYGSWIFGLALLSFWMQSEYVFLGTLGGNLMMLLFAALYLAGCLYFLRFFRSCPYWIIPVLICFYLFSYALIELVAIFFYLTLNHEIQAAIALSSYYADDVFWRLVFAIPGMIGDLLFLAHASHFLDVVYTIIVELGFLSPLALFLIKKDCQKGHQCV